MIRDMFRRQRPVRQGTLRMKLPSGGTLLQDESGARSYLPEEQGGAKFAPVPQPSTRGYMSGQNVFSPMTEEELTAEQQGMVSGLRQARPGQQIRGLVGQDFSAFATNPVPASAGAPAPLPTQRQPAAAPAPVAAAPTAERIIGGQQSSASKAMLARIIPTMGRSRESYERAYGAQEAATRSSAENEANRRARLAETEAQYVRGPSGVATIQGETQREVAGGAQASETEREKLRQAGESERKGVESAGRVKEEAEKGRWGLLQEGAKPRPTAPPVKPEIGRFGTRRVKGTDEQGNPIEYEEAYDTVTGRTAIEETPAPGAAAGQAPSTAGFWRGLILKPAEWAGEAWARKTAPQATVPAAGPVPQGMDQAAFVADYTKKRGMPPTPAQIALAKQKGYWK